MSEEEIIIIGGGKKQQNKSVAASTDSTEDTGEASDEEENSGNLVEREVTKLWKRWTTWSSGLNLTALVAVYVMVPDRMLDALPHWVHGAFATALLAAGATPILAGMKQKPRAPKP